MIEQCAHCWHATSSISTDMVFGNSGCDFVTCCRCGVQGRHLWRDEPDPAHGPVKQIRVYDCAGPVLEARTAAHPPPTPEGR